MILTAYGVEKQREENNNERSNGKASGLGGRRGCGGERWDVIGGHGREIFSLTVSLSLVATLAHLEHGGCFSLRAQPR